MTRARIALTMIAGLLLAACGTTVSPGDRAGLGAGQPGGGASAAPNAGLAAPPSGGTGLSGSTGGTALGGTDTSSTTGGGTGGGSAGGTVGGSSGAATTTGDTAGSVTAAGPGVTATEVRLGIGYCNDCASANAAIGAGGQDPGDTRRYFQAAIDDVNKNGGVLGRKLVPVYHQVSASDNIDASAQAACETFTKDTKVAAFAFRGQLAAACGLKAGVMVLGSGETGPTYDRFPNLFAPPSIRLEGLYGATVRAMVHAGWQKPSGTWMTGKIGLITWDNNDYRYAMKNGYLKAMHEKGLKEDDVRYVAVPQSAGSIADSSAAISSAVLSFQQKGIDHVFIGDGQAGIFSGAGLTLLFLQNAKSQRYYPRYGFNSLNSPEYQNHPKDQLVGMIAIDSADTKASKDEGLALNPVRERCFAIMRKAGLPVGDDQTRGLAENACEIAWFPSLVLNKAGASTLSRVIAAGEALGTAYRSPFSYGNRFGPGRHDGAYLFRNSEFDQGCTCQKYTSKPYEP